MTLLEAIGMAVTGRVNGRAPPEELNPHWFHAQTVQDGAPILEGLQRRPGSTLTPSPWLAAVISTAPVLDLLEPAIVQ